MSERAVSIGGDNRGIISTGDATNIVSVTVGPLQNIEDVPPTGSPVGVPGIGVFVGRDQELAALHTALTESPDSTVVIRAVAGLGGVGKTTLAAAFVQQHADLYSQAAWINADSTADLEAGLARFALALEPHLASVIPAEGLAERAIAWLQTHQHWLVVLDDVTNPEDIQPLVSRTPAGRYVITTRHTTGWNGVGKALNLGVLDPAAARELLERRVGADLGEDADQLVAQLGNLPLALEQAAAYIGQSRLTAADYLRLLASHPAALYAKPPEGRSAESTVAEVLSLALDRLADNPLCGKVMRILAWFAPDDIPVRLLDGMAPDPQLTRALGRLAEYSLISIYGAAVSAHRLVLDLVRTPDEHDPHRLQELVDDARIASIKLLRAALPGDPSDPGTWPSWRELTPHSQSYLDHALPTTDNADVSVVLAQFATFFESQGDFGRAAGYRKRALAYEQSELGPDHPDVLRSRNNLAYSYDSAGDTATAIALYERALADYERVLGPEHPGTLRTRNNLAAAYGRIGDASRSIAMQEQTFAMSTRVLGPDHPDTLAAGNNLAYVYQAAGELSRALSLYEATLSASERVLGPQHPSTLASRNNLAAAYESAGDLSRALPLYQATLAERERILGPDHPDTLTSRNNLAYAYQAAGDLSRALPLYQATLAERERILGPDHPNTLTSRNNLAAAYQAAGDLSRALPLYEATVADRERILGPDHPNTLTSHNNLGMALEAAGRGTEALEHFRHVARVGESGSQYTVFRLANSAISRIRGLGAKDDDPIPESGDSTSRGVFGEDG